MVHRGAFSYNFKINVIDKIKNEALQNKGYIIHQLYYTIQSLQGQMW